MNLTDIDTTPVRCPDYCLMAAGVGRSAVVPRQFLWCDDADEDVGTRNYCDQCGSELVPAESSTIEIVS